MGRYGYQHKLCQEPTKDFPAVTTTPADDHVDTETIAVTRALGGKVSGIDLLRAHVDKNNGEHRPQQEQMVEAVSEAIAGSHPLLVQAGTGTGKSLAYLFPLAASGCCGVIATATNQLSEQLIRYDLPRVQESLAAGGQEMTFAMLKGRNQYACLAKVAEIENFEAAGAVYADQEQDRLFDLTDDQDPSASKRRQAKADAKEVGELIKWVKTTRTGDRSDATPVTDRVWSQVSTTAADCPGAQSCPFGERCFTELARKQARAATIVVTNHAMIAQDVRASLEPIEKNTAPSAGMFGKHQVVIIDEAHDLPDALTAALSSEVDPRALTKFISKAARYIIDDTSNTNADSLIIENTREALEIFEESLESLPSGPLPELPAHTIDALNAIVNRFLLITSQLSKAAGEATSSDMHKRATAISVLVTQAEQHTANLIAARTVGAGRVRWVDHRRAEDAPILKTAPLEVGDALTEALAERTLIATSATLAIGSDFAPIQHTLGQDGPNVVTIDVGSPFDYPKQGMLYIPKAPFPEPVGKDRTAHTEAVLEEVLALVTAAGGRTLALFTTTAGARRAADYLREHLPHLNVHAHGEAPADVLVRQFAEEETSVLCATMGMWQGTNVEGPSCSLVIIDKVAFAPIDDVLTAARRANADSRGRDGFSEVVVAQAATSLAQGAGRLIRTKDDKGVVAVLDPRILTKGYGRTLIKSLPPFKVFTDRNVVLAALERLTGGTTDEQRAAAPAPIGYPKPSARQSGTSSRAPRRASSTRALASGTKLRPRKID